LSADDSNFFVPLDVATSQIRSDGKGYYGVCGPSTIAVLMHQSVQSVIADWAGAFKGYSPLKEMQATLEKLGYASVRIKGNKAKEFPTPTTKTAIIRIQWLKDDGTEFYWAAQTPNTHYVLMQKIDGDWWVFCNSELWFKKDSAKAKDYLKLGYISSYLEISEQHQRRLMHYI
jgi:hypothetical protein